MRNEQTRIQSRNWIGVFVGLFVLMVGLGVFQMRFRDSDGLRNDSEAKGGGPLVPASGTPSEKNGDVDPGSNPKNGNQNGVSGGGQSLDPEPVGDFAASPLLPTGGDPAPRESIADLLDGVDLRDEAERARIVSEIERVERTRKENAWEKAKRLGIPTEFRNEHGEVEAVLVDFDGEIPRYIATNNANASISSAATPVRDAPYGATGSGLRIGIWDSGAVRPTHQEFGGRVILGDSSSFHGHSTHVGGTIGASGVVPAAQGMAPEVSLVSYNWDLHMSEMTGAGAVLPLQSGSVLASNHSYSTYKGYAIAGGAWRWFGSGTNSTGYDADFGRYGSYAREMDSVAYALSYTSVFVAAGNDRGEAPSEGAKVYYGQFGSNFTFSSENSPKPDGIYKNGFDTLGDLAAAKNVITVGAVNDAVSVDGFRSTADADMTTFSSWGPTDDGRIKPDIVANGTSVYSTWNQSDSFYTTEDGTSMATPSASGAAMLLIDYYAKRFPGEQMRASTLKGLLIHTADDLGRPGPDYEFGWGLLNTDAAAQLIRNHADGTGDGLLGEETLTRDVTSREHTFVWDGTKPLRVTLSWADKIPTSTINEHDSRTRALVNDLDLSVTPPGGGPAILPYVMPYVGDWTMETIDAVATTGVNTVDPVEQIYLAPPLAPGAYTVRVAVSGSLATDFQPYSLIVSGEEEEGLRVSPTEISEIDGYRGGPFSPSPVSVTATNSGSDPVAWEAAASDAWLGVSPSSGVLAPGASVELQVSTTTTAESLLGGKHVAKISVTNLDTEVSQDLPVLLTVRSAYFVNDASLTNDNWCSAVGSDANDGTRPGRPKATVQSLLAEHDLEPGDIVYIDTGSYLLTSDIVVDPAHGGTPERKVVFEASPYGVVMNRNVPGTSAVYGWKIHGVAQVTLQTSTELNLPGIAPIPMEIGNVGSGTGFITVVSASGDGFHLNRVRIRTKTAGACLDLWKEGTVENCLFRGGRVGLWGVYDKTLKNCTIEGRVTIERSSGTHLSNNLFVKSSASAISVSEVSNPPSFVSDRNCFFLGAGARVGSFGGTILQTLTDWQAATGQDANSLSSDPLFLDRDGPDDIPGNGDDDFRLSHLSPCRDVGDSSVIGSGSLDLGFGARIFGESVDLGAHEFSGVSSVAVSGAGNGIASGDLDPGLSDGTDFGGVPALAGNVVRTFSIRNDGDDALSVSAVFLEDNPVSAFAMVQYPDAVIPPGGSSEFQIAFDPPTIATHEARVLIETSDAGNNPYVFGVRGIGEKVPQSITVANPGDQLANATVNLSAEGGGSGNPVTFSVSGPASINGSNVMSFTGTGSVTVRANQAGNDDYLDAPEVAHTFNVTKANATVTLGNLFHTYNGSAKSATATTNPTGLPVSIVHNPASPVNAGSYGVTATINDPIYQGGANGTLVISKATQTITGFSNPGPRTANTTVNLSATGGGSGNPVTFSATGPASINGSNVMSFTGTGSVTVRANQAGNGNYFAAPEVAHTFTVSAASANVSLTNTIQAYNGSPRSVTVTTSPPGLSHNVVYVGQPGPPTNVGIYGVNVTITDPRYTGYGGADLVIQKASQTINFPTPPDTVETATVNLSATGGGSGNPVTFAITSGPAYFSGTNKIRFFAPGNVTITASQAGNSNYNAATQVVRTFQVDDSTATVTISKLLQVADGSPRSVVVTTDPPGLNVIVTYAGNSTPPSQPGRYAVVATVDDALYDGSAQETLVLDDPGALVRVPGGTLPPGSDLGFLDVPTFQIGRYETTWGLWKTVRDWGAANGYDLADRGAGCADGHPVRDVNWFDAVKWCNARTEWEGATRGISLTPVYRVGGAIYRSGEPDPATVVADESAGGYRLPTAEEWEFAARGGDDGTNYPYPGGYDPTPLAWFRDNSSGAVCPISGGRGTWPVGEKSPNELGIHDLAGNIAEWTGSELPGVPVARYFRGGAWDLSASYCEIGNLLDQGVENRIPILGFRVARSIAAALPVALDHDDVTWESFGAQPWFAQTGISHDGVDAAESGAVLPGEESHLEAVFTGPGNLSFRWKAEAHEGTDLVELYLGDSSFEGSLSGATAWEYVTLEIPEGDWPVRWIFSRRPQSPSGVSRVWVDEVAFESAFAPAVTTGAASYLDDATARFAGEVTDDGGREVTARGVVYATTPVPTLETGTVLSAPSAGTGSFTVDAPVAVSTVYYARAFATNHLGTSYGDEVVYFSSNSDPVNFGDGIETFGLQIEPGSRRFFTFSLDRDRIVSLSSAGGAALRAILRDQSGNVMSRSDEGSDFVLEPILERGWYVLEVFPDSGSTDAEDFQLTFDWTVEATRRTEVEVGPTPSRLTGGGVYDPIPQSVAIFSTKARPVSGYARVRNTGTMPDALTVRAGGRNVYFNVIWFGPAGNVTAGLLTGTYQTAPSNQGDSGELFRASVVPNKKKLIKKKRKRILILKKVVILPVSADSVGNPEHSNSHDSATIRVLTK